MPKFNEIKELRIGSIGYVHDPEAAQKWFEIFVEAVKKELLKTNSNQIDELNKMEENN